MRKILFSAALLPLSFAEGQIVQGAVNELEGATRAVLLVSSAVFFLAGIILAAAGIAIYARKIRGNYKPKAIHRAAAFALGGLGLIALLAGIMGFAIFLLAPGLVRGLLVSPG